MILLTGSEDTFLKVCEYTKGQALTVKQIFSNHVASIRAIRKTKLHSHINGPTKEYIVVSAGSRM
jgi:hypothetical protein